jgi:hypothetical protein
MSQYDLKDCSSFGPAKEYFRGSIGMSSAGMKGLP